MSISGKITEKLEEQFNWIRVRLQRLTPPQRESGQPGSTIIQRVRSASQGVLDAVSHKESSTLIIDAKTRLEKDRISEKCLGLLKKVVGEMSLDSIPQDILNLPEGIVSSVDYEERLLEIFEEKVKVKIHDGKDEIEISLKDAYKTWKLEVEEIQKMIQNPPQELHACSEHRKKLQNLICQALQRPIYQKLKNYECDPIVHFLHTAADIIHNHSEGMFAFEDLGKRLIGDLENKEYNYNELGNLMDLAREESSHDSTDSIKGRIQFSLSHPQRTLGSVISEMDTSHYNPYDVGNYNALLGFYTVDGFRIQSSAGPNPAHSDYAIFPAVNQRNENLAQLREGIAPSHVQVILEGAENKKGAKERRRTVVELEKEAPNQFKAISLPLDGDLWKGRNDFQAIYSAGEFNKKIQERMEQTHRSLSSDSLGFYFPKEALTHDRLSMANVSFIRAFSSLEGTDKWQELTGKNKLSKTLLLGYDAILVLNSMAQVADQQKEAAKSKNMDFNLTLDGLPLSTTWNMACKQGIDRGVILNMTVRLLVDALEKGSFEVTQEQMYQYCGYTVGRARTVESRKIMEDRYEALRNLISLISAATPEQQKAFLESLGEFLPKMSFTPSHQIH